MPEETAEHRLAPRLRGLLLDAAVHTSPHAAPGGHVPAAVLVPLFEQNGELHVVLTRRRADLRRHAGEVSFPGGRFDPGEDPDLLTTALRETEEELGLARTDVAVVGALERTTTFVTNYAIHPFVGVFDCERRWELSALEVDAVLEPSLDAVRAGRTRTRIERRGIAFDTDAYLLGTGHTDGHTDGPNGGDRQLVWGATARILDDLFERIGPLLDRRAIG